MRIHSSLRRHQLAVCRGGNDLIICNAILPLTSASMPIYRCPMTSGCRWHLVDLTRTMVRIRLGRSFDLSRTDIVLDYRPTTKHYNNIVVLHPNRLDII